MFLQFFCNFFSAAVKVLQKGRIQLAKALLDGPWEAPMGIAPFLLPYLF
jgi:hypothetical protein